MTRRQALAAIATGPALSQTKENRGRKVLEDCIQALGGNRFMNMKDRVESGRAYSFYHGRLSGLSRAAIYTRYLTPPTKPEVGKLYVRERQNFGKDQDYGAIFAEDKGFQISFRGAAPMPAETFARYHDTTRRNIFYFLRIRMDEPGLSIEFKSAEVFENQPVDVVDIDDSENNTTRLPVRQLFYRRDAQRERHEEIALYSKYRSLGGVQWPYSITRYRDAVKIYEIFSEKVEIDRGLDDSLFILPANVKMLPPPK